MKVILDERDIEMLESGEWAKILDESVENRSIRVGKVGEEYIMKFTIKDSDLFNLFFYQIICKNLHNNDDSFSDNTGIDILEFAAGDAYLSRNQVSDYINNFREDILNRLK